MGSQSRQSLLVRWELSFEQMGNQLTFTLLPWNGRGGHGGASQVYLTGEAVKKDGMVYDLSPNVPLNKASGSNVYKTTVYLKETSCSSLLMVVIGDIARAIARV